MNNSVENYAQVLLDNSVTPETDNAVAFELSKAFERDARRYNRAFQEEREVAVG